MSTATTTRSASLCALRAFTVLFIPGRYSWTFGEPVSLAASTQLPVRITSVDAKYANGCGPLSDRGGPGAHHS